jgi:predicted transcriptional regulator
LTVGVFGVYDRTMKPLPLLGELESAVLEHLWVEGPSDVKEVHRQLGDPRGITLNTVQSTLERLHRKELLLREKVSHAYRYAPAMTRERFRARAMADAAGDLRGAAAEGVIAAFVEIAARADRANLDRLARVVEEARARRTKGKA